MKKITFLIFAVVVSLIQVNAQNTLNNPKDANGLYIVKWDCTNNRWASSNNFEVDETFTFAVDVTGTAWETWLKETPTTSGATRSLAINRWTGFGDVDGATNRMKPITGNIYGATWNIAQLATTMNIASATTLGAQTYVIGQVFGFEYTADAPGAGWWMWPSSIPGGTNIDPLGNGGAIFATSPYTGTKTSAEFYNNDYDNLLFGTNYPEKGYAPACAVITSVQTPTISKSPVIGHKYYDIQGAELYIEPNQGLFIYNAIKADGTFDVNKVLKVKE